MAKKLATPIVITIESPNEDIVHTLKVKLSLWMKKRRVGCIYDRITLQHPTKRHLKTARSPTNTEDDLSPDDKKLLKKLLRGADVTFVKKVKA